MAFKATTTPARETNTRRHTSTHSTHAHSPVRQPQISAAVIFHDVDAWRHRHAAPPEIRAASVKQPKKRKGERKRECVNKLCEWGRQRATARVGKHQCQEPEPKNFHSL